MSDVLVNEHTVNSMITNNENPICVAVVGVGSDVDKFLNKMKKHCEFEITCIEDEDIVKTENLLQKHFLFGARIYNELEKMFLCEKVDAVFLSNDVVCYEEKLIVLLEHGLNVLLSIQNVQSIDYIARSIKQNFSKTQTIIKTNNNNNKNISLNPVGKIFYISL